MQERMSLALLQKQLQDELEEITHQKEKVDGCTQGPLIKESERESGVLGLASRSREAPREAQRESGALESPREAQRESQRRAQRESESLPGRSFRLSTSLQVPVKEVEDMVDGMMEAQEVALDKHWDGLRRKEEEIRKEICNIMGITDESVGFHVPPEPKRNKTHHDYMMNEMRWRIKQSTMKYLQKRQDSLDLARECLEYLIRDNNETEKEVVRKNTEEVCWTRFNCSQNVKVPTPVKFTQNTKLSLKHFSPSYPLLPFQKSGINWMFQMYQKCINFIVCDEDGLGRKVQSIGLISKIYNTLCKNYIGCMVLCQEDEIKCWFLEFQRWCPDLTVHLFEHPLMLHDTDVLFITYKQFQHHFSLFLSDDGIQYDFVVVHKPVIHVNSPSWNSILQLETPKMLILDDRDECDDSELSKFLSKKDNVAIKKFCLERKFDDIRKEFPHVSEHIISIEETAHDEHLYNQRSKAGCEFEEIAENIQLLRKITNHHLLIDPDCSEPNVESTCNGLWKETNGTKATNSVMSKTGDESPLRRRSKPKVSEESVSSIQRRQNEEDMNLPLKSVLLNSKIQELQRLLLGPKNKSKNTLIIVSMPEMIPILATALHHWNLRTFDINNSPSYAIKFNNNPARVIIIPVSLVSSEIAHLSVDNVIYYDEYFNENSKRILNSVVRMLSLQNNELTLFKFDQTPLESNVFHEYEEILLSESYREFFSQFELDLPSTRKYIDVELDQNSKVGSENCIFELPTDPVLSSEHDMDYFEIVQDEISCDSVQEGFGIELREPELSLEFKESRKRKRVQTFTQKKRSRSLKPVDPLMKSTIPEFSWQPNEDQALESAIALAQSITSSQSTVNWDFIAHLLNTVYGCSSTVRSASSCQNRYKGIKHKFERNPAMLLSLGHDYSVYNVGKLADNHQKYPYQYKQEVVMPERVVDEPKYNYTRPSQHVKNLLQDEYKAMMKRKLTQKKKMTEDSAEQPLQRPPIVSPIVRSVSAHHQLPSNFTLINQTSQSSNRRSSFASQPFHRR